MRKLKQRGLPIVGVEPTPHSVSGSPAALAAMHADSSARLRSERHALHPRAQHAEQNARLRIRRSVHRSR
jgi:hypothetical protein